MRSKKLANFLGWFSLGLGTAEIVAPRTLGRVTGVGKHPWLTRIFGMREVASGIGILTQRRKAGWLWARVAGDALDVAAMGMATAGRDSKPMRIAAASVAVAPIIAMDIMCARDLSNMSGEKAA